MAGNRSELSVGSTAARSHWEMRGHGEVLRETPSLTPSIADALTIKDGNVFFLSKRDGSLPLDHHHGLGLYYHDTRYLNGYELRLAGLAPNLLVSTASKGYAALLELTNPELSDRSGNRLVRKEEIGIRRQLVLNEAELRLYDSIVLRNFSSEQLEFPLTLLYRATFEDVFAVRSLIPNVAGTLRQPRWEEDTLVFQYEGGDRLCRRLLVRLWPAPDVREGILAGYDVVLAPRGEVRIVAELQLAEDEHFPPPSPKPRSTPSLELVERAHEQDVERWLAHHTQVESSSLLLDGVIRRSLADLHMLQSSVQGHAYYAAGVPWFVALFGRDSIITALQMLAFDRDLAEQTLKSLAAYQGQKMDPEQEEEPGRILHELRVGELAHTGEIPFTPYYGTIDATPLFLVLLREHAAWTGDLALFRELRPQVEAALGWLRDFGGLEDGGYLSYQDPSRRGLQNQGWKDSWDGVPNDDGTLAEPPISLVEAQGYAYAAQLGIAWLLRQNGEHGQAEELEEAALRLKRRFNEDFWLPDKRFYALALQRGGRPAAVLSSNPGHALWSGIVDEARAGLVVERLMAPELYSGWGVRTLAESEPAYNPIGYHVGTVWPHDTSLVAAGIKRYGFHAAAGDLFSSMVRAAMHFEGYRLPELFAGFPRSDYDTPVRYPLANSPQAWAAGAIPFMFQTSLGLEPDAFARRLRIAQPVLPDFLKWVELRGIKVGPDSVDLRFTRSAAGIAVEVLGKRGELKVTVEL